MATRTNTTKAAVTTAKAEKDPLDGDFTYLATKEPGEVAQLHAALIKELTGLDITAQQVQAVLSMHGKIQRSEANRKRAGYKPRTAQSIRKGGETTVEHMDVRLAEEAPKPARKPRARKAAAPKAAPAADNKATEVAVAS